ncbi:hypothetical protein EV182_004896, partial [Spiromyces aspiralis]
MYPLDGKQPGGSPRVAKTRLQLQVGKGGANQYNSVLDVFRHIIKEEGPTRLYRGIIPPIMVEAPKRAVKFAANEQYGQLYLKLFGKTKMDQSTAILTGISAGITEALIVSEPELIKIRLQARENAGKYAGTMDCIRKIYAQEGFMTFFNGLESTIWRHALWNGGYFGSIFAIREALPKAETKKGQLGVNFIAGALGGTIGTALNTPADVIKTRIQNHLPEHGPFKYKHYIPGLVTVVKEEGFAALYKGFVPK